MGLTKLLIYILATYRLTEFIMYDDAPFDAMLNVRNAIFDKAVSGNKFYQMLAKLLSCPYCVGFWSAFIILVMPKTIRLAFAIAGGQSLLQRYIDYVENRPQLSQNSILTEEQIRSILSRIDNTI